MEKYLVTVKKGVDINEFYDDMENVIYTHQPITDEMIIFPNYLLHQPLKSNSDEYRIAINIEIKCNDVWKNNDTV